VEEYDDAFAAEEVHTTREGFTNNETKNRVVGLDDDLMHDAALLLLCLVAACDVNHNDLAGRRI
jgi:hypothetical protein